MTVANDGNRETQFGVPERLPAAGLWRRFMGITYEALVVFAVAFFFGYGFSAMLRFQGQPGVLRDLFQWFLVLVLGTYFTWFWSLGRRTLPMKAVALLITDREDRPISTLRAMLRFMLAALMALAAVGLAARFHPALLAVALVPLAWCLIDPDRQALYDRLAGTRLVVSDPKPKAPAQTPPAPETQLRTQSTK
jgi:uncharacterized RDD family membrane protein YckC